MSKWMKFAAIAAFGFLVAMSPATADSNILFILDASGSMFGKVEAMPKIATAKTSLSKLLGELPADAKIGLMVYGHRSKSDCQDVELVAPIGATEPGALGGKIEAVTPLGKTPIAYSLSQSAAAFANLAGQNNNVVLISDGVESCDGDPCRAAADLAAEGIGVRVHVIGFGLTPEENAQLQCIADNGNGKYFAANSTAGFGEAVTEVVRTAEASQPAAVTTPASAPAEKSRMIVFSDEFDGSALSADWEVLNPNPNNYVVENGTLLNLSSGQGGLGNPDIANIFKLLPAPPESDYTVTVKLSVEFATGRENFSIGLFDDKDNYIETSITSETGSCGSMACYLSLHTTKVSGGQAVEFVASIDQYSPSDTPQPVVLRLVKEGRTYRGSVNFASQKNEAGELVWITTEPVTSLRAPKSLVMNTSQRDAVKGETTFNIDSITVDVPGE